MIRFNRLVRPPGYHILSEHDLPGFRRYVDELRRRRQDSRQRSRGVLVDGLAVLAVFLIVGASSDPTPLVQILSETVTVNQVPLEQFDVQLSFPRARLQASDDVELGQLKSVMKTLKQKGVQHFVFESFGATR